jgi:hypothetical protein
MPPNAANAPKIVDEQMAGEDLRGEGAASTGFGLVLLWTFWVW